jgi:hypothetical protein
VTVQVLVTVVVGEHDGAQEALARTAKARKERNEILANMVVQKRGRVVDRDDGHRLGFIYLALVQMTSEFSYVIKSSDMTFIQNIAKHLSN